MNLAEEMTDPRIPNGLWLLDRCFSWSCMVFFAAIAACLPLGTIVEIGGDEGFELLKAFLCYKGYVLYSEIWNDQPPAHTLLLAGLFHVTGVSVFAARVVAVVFGATLVGVFAGWLRRELGLWPAAFGVGVLLSAPWVLALGVSVMLEMPAFATGLLAAWLLQQRRRLFEPCWLGTSAITLALALQIKLTAGLLVPGLLVLLLQQPRVPGVGGSGADQASVRTTRRLGGYDEPARQTIADPGRRSSRRWIATLGFWLLILVSAYALLCWLLGTGGYDLLWASHHAPRMYAELEREGGHAFSFSRLAEFPEGIVGSVLGAGLAIWQRQWRRIAFPGLWLITALVTHWQHRPWWDYYLLHFAIPMSWLAAQALHSLQGLRFTSEVQGGLKTQRLRRWAAAPGILLASLWVVYGGDRLVHGIAFLRACRTIQETPLLGEMQRHAPRVRWMFTYHPIYAFHARLPVPPPLAILPAKRFWSGRLTDTDLVNALQRWKPELLLLESAHLNERWCQWIRDDFLLVAQDENLFLYAHKTIVEDQPRSIPSRPNHILEKRVGYEL